jgi:ATP-dependent HslUV protease ATP-binding subunit HslU
MTSLKPSEIVGQLDRHIIGQKEAKRAIAIALRNRWRRLQLAGNKQLEIIPRNILMVGPTGVGKTEIARRLAKLANAPFVKVEATKFTEVGYHGRDVDTIIRDLVDASMVLVRQLKEEEYRGEIEPLVERRILEALTGPEARPDTVESFRRLLRAGSLDDREIQISVPVQQSDGDFELNVSSGTIDIGDFMRKMGSAGQGGRVERRKMKVKDCYPILQSAELERKLAGLDIKREAIELAEQNGIVFIDEIDKIVSDSSKYSSDASAEGVQRDLLPLIEGSNVDMKRYGNVKMDHVLFVVSGAFHECKSSDMLAEL